MVTITSDIIFFIKVNYLSTHSYICMDVNDCSHAGFLQADKLNGDTWIFVKNRSGWVLIVAIGWLSCFGPNRFSNCIVQFWLINGDL